MKKILVFSNREQIGDGIIKLPFVHEIKKRFPNYIFIWATNSGTTVYNHSIKNIANQYIDVFYEKIPLISFFLRKKTHKYDLKQTFDIIIDTQKAVMRTIALRRLKTKIFISSSANWFFSDIKPQSRIKDINNFYLNDLFFMLNLISKDTTKDDFRIKIPNELNIEIDKIFFDNKKYFGFSPGSATKNRIWKIENFIKVAKYVENLNFVPTFFLGPLEKDLKEIIITDLPNAFFPEDLIKNFSGPEVVMAASKYLFCSLANDSGTSHMLSINSKSLIKLIGPTTSKFTPKNNRFHIIDSKLFGSKDINSINPNDVIDYIKKQILKS